MEEVEKEKSLMQKEVGTGKTLMEMDERERSTTVAEVVLESETPREEVED